MPGAKPGRCPMPGAGQSPFSRGTVAPHAAATVQGLRASQKKGLARVFFRTALHCCRATSVPGGGWQSVGVAFLRPTVAVVKANKPPPTRHAPMHGHGGDWRVETGRSKRDGQVMIPPRAVENLFFISLAGRPDRSTCRARAPWWSSSLYAQTKRQTRLEQGVSVVT